MSILKGNLLYGQSGGPTSVINATAYGVINEAKKHPEIGSVYCMINGIVGAIKDNVVCMDQYSEEQLELLKQTPGAALKSARYKLADYHKDDTDYMKILNTLKKYDIRYFLFNGGNDSMDTSDKLMHFLDTVDYECRILGLPKTIDNDLVYTDHCPGFGSAAKFVANTMTQIATDLEAYPTGKVTVVEIMGRNAGWLTGASCIACLAGCGPDLIYLPEIPFSIGKFKRDVARVYEKNKRCLVAVSEGIRDADGIVYGESPAAKDAFGHAQLGGVATMLANVIKTDLGYPSRGIEFNVMQRASTYLLSKTDLEESVTIGRIGVQWILEGKTRLMVCMKREEGPEYKISHFGQALPDIANGEQLIPRNWINADGNGVTQEFFDYVRPLILGEVFPSYKNGVIEMFRL